MRRYWDIFVLIVEFEREKDKDEKENILSTLMEIIRNEAFGVPTQTIEEWEQGLIKNGDI